MTRPVVVALADAAPVVASSRPAVRASAAAVAPATSCVTGHSSACPIRITFASGAYSCQPHSTMSVVNLRANQYVIVRVIGKQSTRGTIYFRGGGGERQPGGRIYDDHVPRSGDYKIKVTESLMGEGWSGRVDVLVVAI